MDIFDEKATTTYRKSAQGLKDLSTLVSYYSRILQIYEGDYNYETLHNACRDFYNDKNYVGFLKKIRSIKESKNVQ